MQRPYSTTEPPQQILEAQKQCFPGGISFTFNPITRSCTIENNA